MANARNRRNTRNRRKALLLALSDIAFRNAEALLRNIIESRVGDEDAAYPGLIAGVVVTYARPFTNSNGLGGLPEAFRRIPVTNGESLQEVHDYVMDMRHKLYAHYDLSAVSQIRSSAPELRDPREIHLAFAPHGFAVTTNELRPPVGNLPRLGRLFATQQQRIRLELIAHLISWLGTLPTEGEFFLSESGLVPAGTGGPAT